MTDPAELNAVNTDASIMYGPIFEAVLEYKDNVEGVRRLIDSSGQKEGYFANQSPDRQEIELDNARTMPLLLEQSAPPVITWEQLSVLPMPVCILQGEKSCPVFSIVSRAAAHCIPGCQHRVIPGVNHMWPDENPQGFSAVLSNFLNSL